jgi:hypothetical protein
MDKLHKKENEDLLLTFNEQELETVVKEREIRYSAGTGWVSSSVFSENIGHL